MMMADYELRPAQGLPDDMVFHGVGYLHIEQMDYDSWWMGIEVAGKRFRLVFYSATKSGRANKRGRINCMIEDDSDDCDSAVDIMRELSKGVTIKG